MSIRQRTAILAKNSTFGRAATLKFRSLNADLLVVAQSENAAERALGLGASDAVVADTLSVDSLAAALSGVDTLIYDPGLHRHSGDGDPATLVEAASRAAVSHVIFLSCLRPLSLRSRGFQLRTAFEQALATSTLRYSVLQPAMFMQNIGFLMVNLQHDRTLSWPWDPSRRFAMVDVMDVAEVAANLSVNPSLAGGTYELCAEEIIPEAIADQLSSLLGYRIAAVRGDAASGKQPYDVDVSPGWSPDALDVRSSPMDMIGYPGGNSFVLSRLLGRAPSPVETFIRRMSSSFLTVHEDRKLSGEALIDAMFQSLMSSEL